MPETVLFIVAHPNLRTSQAHWACMQAASTIAGIEVFNLYAAYPDMHVDGRADHARLEAASTRALQHPIHWYAMPGRIKEWFDRIFSHGWAYGQGGDALRGKKFMCSITTGSAAGAYGAEGVHGHPIADYLKPCLQIARFCGME